MEKPVIQKLRDSWRTCVAVAVGLLLLIAFVLPWVVPLHFNYGPDSITIRAGSAKTGLDFPDRQFGFCQDGMDIPAPNEFRHWRSYGFKALNWVYRIDDASDPKSYVTRHLPQDCAGLLKALDDSDFVRRLAAVDAIEQRGSEVRNLLPGLIAMLNGGNDYVPGVIQMLAESNTAYAVPLLADCVDHGKSIARNHAIEILGELGPSAAIALPALERSLTSHSPKTRFLAALTVAKIDRRAASAVPVLIKMLNGDDDKYRPGAAYALGEFGPLAAPAVSALITALKSTDTNVSALSARTLGLIGPAAKPAIPFLIQNLDRQDAQILQWTTQSLAKFGKDAKAAIPRLAELSNAEDDISRDSIKALGQMGSDAVQSLVVLFTNGPEDRITFVANSLAKIGPEATNAVPEMLDALQSDSARTVGLALKVLGAIGPAAKPALPQVLVLMKDEEANLRLRAAQAAWKIGLEKEKVIPMFIGALQGHLEDRFGERCTAVEALGELGPDARAALPLLREEAIGKDPRSHSSLQDDAVAAIQKISAPEVRTSVTSEVPAESTPSQ